MPVEMDKFVIKGIPPFDGEHPIDLGTLNGHELHRIKIVAGVRANELDEALVAGDYDVFVALAATALERNGHPQAPDAVEVLMGATAGKLRFVLADRENGDGDGPDPHPPTADE